MLGQGSSFEADATIALGRLRSRLGDVIARLPTEISRAADLHHALRIDRNLSWRVFKVATSTDPLATGLVVPGPGHLNTFFRAAAKRGVPVALIDAASRAAADVEEVISKHAGDRATFDSMISSLVTGGRTEQVDLQHRRLAFRGQRHICGVHARTQLSCRAVQPAEDPSLVDIAKVEGYLKLRQIRAGAPLAVFHDLMVDDDGTVLQLAREPLDPSGMGEHGVALLRRFCSRPLPTFEAVKAEGGFIHGRLRSTGLGNVPAIDCLAGNVTRGAPRFRSRHDTHGHSLARTRLPTEVLIHDMLVRTGTFAPTQPTAATACEQMGTAPPDLASRSPDWPTFPATVQHLGRGLSVVRTPDVPGYIEMLEYVFDRLGWQSEEFDVYRCRIEYPVLPSTTGISFELADAPLR
jgi:hypothetical protein